MAYAAGLYRLWCYAQMSGALSRALASPCGGSATVEYDPAGGATAPSGTCPKCETVLSANHNPWELIEVLRGGPVSEPITIILEEFGPKTWHAIVEEGQWVGTEGTGTTPAKALDALGLAIAKEQARAG